MSLLEFRVLNENDSRCPFGDGSEHLDVSLGQSHLHSGCLVPGRDVRDGEDRSSLADDELRIQVPYLCGTCSRHFAGLCSLCARF